ncbi:MAG: hypothetical protein WD942_08230 [Dehalococcoidia bacterium]
MSPALGAGSADGQRRKSDCKSGPATYETSAEGTLVGQRDAEPLGVLGFEDHRETPRGVFDLNQEGCRLPEVQLSGCACERAETRKGAKS